MLAIIVGSEADGSGKSKVLQNLIKPPFNGLTLTSICYNVDENDPRRKERVPGEDRVFINKEIFEELKSRKCIFTEEYPAAYKGETAYLYLKSLPQDILSQVLLFNKRFTTFEPRRESFLVSNSLSSISQSGKNVILEAIPEAISKFADKLQGEGYRTILPLIFGVGLEASIKGQLFREGYIDKNGNPNQSLSDEEYRNKREFAAQKAYDSFKANSEHIWALLGNRDNLNVLPIANVGSEGALSQTWLSCLNTYISLLSAEKINEAKEYQSKVFGMCYYSLGVKELRNSARITAGFENEEKSQDQVISEIKNKLLSIMNQAEINRFSSMETKINRFYEKREKSENTSIPKIA
jgi:hypothetical protein